MKRTLLVALSLLFLFAAGCTYSGEQIPPEENAPPAVEEPQGPTEAAPEPAALTAADLQEVLAALDLNEATLTYRSETEESYAAGNAIRAESYVSELTGLIWAEYLPASEWDQSADYFYRLTTPKAEITVFQGGLDSNRPLYMTTDDGAGWFIVPYIESQTEEHRSQTSWMGYDIFSRWFNEARAAAHYAGTGTALSAEELSFFEAYTEGTWTEFDTELGGYTGGSTPISCFFTSYYDDVTSLDFQEFMRYFPGVGNTGFATDAEFEALKEVEAWPFDWVETRADMPVPIHKYPRSQVDEVLLQYAGITTAELDTGSVAYLPEYDAYYNYTSDFGPGMFTPCYGEKSGDTVTLWGAPNWYEDSVPMLTLQKDGEGWRILAHRNAAS